MSIVVNAIDVVVFIIVVVIVVIFRSIVVVVSSHLLELLGRRWRLPIPLPPTMLDGPPAFQYSTLQPLPTRPNSRAACSHCGTVMRLTPGIDESQRGKFKFEILILNFESRKKNLKF